MTSIKGKIIPDTGSFYTPYIPTHMTWQAQLLFWENELRDKYGYADSLNVISDCMDLMQRSYPGKYSLQWTQTKPNEYHLMPVFNDPKHETLWKLKYE